MHIVRPIFSIREGALSGDTLDRITFNFTDRMESTLTVFNNSAFNAVKSQAENPLVAQIILLMSFADRPTSLQFSRSEFFYLDNKCLINAVRVSGSGSGTYIRLTSLLKTLRLRSTNNGS